MIAVDSWISEPGFYPDMNEVDYFADPCPTPSLRQSGIKILNGKSPYHFAFSHPRLNPYRAAKNPTSYMVFGSAVHSLALGRGREVSIIRYPDFRNESAKRARDAAIGAGRIPVLEREYARASAVAGEVRAAIEDELQGAEYWTEVPFFWIEETEFGPVWCGGMLDVWCPSLRRALDVKASVIALTAESIGRDMAANGYDVQYVWYPRGLSRLIPEAGGFSFGTLYVESEAPHGWTVNELDESSRMIAESACDRAVRRFAQCLHARTWPSYPRRQVVGTPGFHHQTEMVRQLSEEI